MSSSGSGSGSSGNCVGIPGVSSSVALGAPRGFHGAGLVSVVSRDRGAQAAEGEPHSEGVNAANLVQQVRILLQEGMFKSASILAQFAIEHVTNKLRSSERQRNGGDEDLYCEHVESYVLLGDAFSGLREFKRSIKYYRAGLAKLDLQSSKPSNGSWRMEACAGIRIKIADALLSISDEDYVNEACSTLEAIPSHQRPIRAHVLLGQLYEKMSRPKAAISAYRSVLALNPMALSASLALVRLEADVRSIYGIYSDSHPWIGRLLEGHSHLVSHNHSAALNIFSSLLSRFPNNVHLLIHKASTQLQLSDPDEARKTFEFVQEVDEFNLDSMDMFAWILRTRGNVNDLNRLTRRLLSLDIMRPEPWIAVALYSDQRNEREKAMQFLDKAIALNKSHIGAYLVKGFISLSMGCPEQAVAAYKQAHHIDRRELAAYQGLVEAFLALPQFNEALFMAKSALQLLPKNPRALTLFGMVLAHSPDGQDRARRAFDKALSYDPKCIDAVLALVKLFVAQEKYPEAISLLEKHLSHHNQDFVHTKLANVYALSGRIEEALYHYHTALSLCPTYTPALAGIERLSGTNDSRASNRGERRHREANSHDHRDRIDSPDYDDEDDDDEDDDEFDDDHEDLQDDFEVFE